MRRIAAATVCAMLLSGLAVGLTACGSGDDSSTTTTTSTTSAAKPGSGGGKRSGGGGPGAPPKSRPAHPRDRHFDRPPGSRLRSTYPARIIGHGLASSGPIQPEELWPVRNGWRVSDHRTFTAVYAGANPRRRSTGRLVIFRQNYIRVRQTSRDVDVPGTGPVRIVDAPTGKGIGRSAQRHGEIEFRGANGATGTLHLENDTVTVTSGASGDKA